VRLRSNLAPSAPSPVARLAKVDLNLLVILRELLRERSVTRAAERVALTQPAASAALARLRRHFNDELLVRSRGGYTLSPLARQLVEHVERACAAAERVFELESDFHPATTTREFTVLMADYTVAVLGQTLARHLSQVAPRARLHLRVVRPALALEAPDVIRRLDGIVAPPMDSLMLAHVRRLELFRDRWVCVASRANRLLGDGPVELERLADFAWVVPYLPDPGAPATAPLPQQLALLGIQPQTAVRVDSYLAVPYMVAGTDRIAFVQARLAERLADALGLRVLDCALRPLEIIEMLWWCEDHDGDPAHAWFRRTLLEVSAGL